MFDNVTVFGLELFVVLMWFLKNDTFYKLIRMKMPNVLAWLSVALKIVLAVSGKLSLLYLFHY